MFPTIPLRFPLALFTILFVSAGTLFAQPPSELVGLSPGIVLVADGSGGLPGPACELSKLATSNTLLRVEIVHWTYGTGMVILDMWGHINHRKEGKELADRIVNYRAECPNLRIYLVGHSAGAAVILAATECLPPGIVTRVILLAPSVSCKYDVRPALACSIEGVDVFYSHRDMISLSMFMTATSDLRPLVGPAGYKGFRTTPAGGCCDDGAYANLRQHPNLFAGHFACTEHAFLRDHVMPLMFWPLPTLAPPPPPDIPGDDSDVTSAARGAIHTASYRLSAIAQQALALESLLPDDDFECTAPVRQGPAPAAGRSGIAPISDTLRLP